MKIGMSVSFEDPREPSGRWRPGVIASIPGDAGSAGPTDADGVFIGVNDGSAYIVFVAEQKIRMVRDGESK